MTAEKSEEQFGSRYPLVQVASFGADGETISCPHSQRRTPICTLMQMKHV